jgi:hypothetical protein
VPLFVNLFKNLHLQILYSIVCNVGWMFFLRPGRGADHPPLLAPSSRKSRAIPVPPSGPSGLLRGTFTFTFNVLLTVHRSISVSWNQRDALFIQFIKN